MKVRGPWVALASAGLVAALAGTALLRGRQGMEGVGSDVAAERADSVAPSGSQALGARACLAPDARVSLDHVILAVSDLEAAATAYRSLGFTLKEGRRHPNGLLNKHVKLADGSELELMTLAAAPGDDMARGYAEILARGGGGAYVACRAPAGAVLEAARSLGIAVNEARGGTTRYVTFGAMGNESVFFLEGPSPAPDPDSLLTHANGATGLAEAWVEAGEELGRLLLALGGVACGARRLPDGREAQSFGVAGGSVVVAPPEKAWARLLGASLVGSGGGEATRWLPPSRTLGLWLGVPAGPGG